MSDIPRNPAPEDGAGLGPSDEVEPEIADDLDTGTDEAGGDDGDSEADEPEAEGEVAAPPRRGGGGDRGVRDRRAERQALERSNEALRRELDELRQGQRQLETRFQADPAALARAEQEFYASLAYMPEEQRLQAVVQRERQTMGQVLQGMAQRQEDLADQARFDASCARSPSREAYRDKAETFRQQQLRAGFVLSREDAYHILLGRDTDAARNKALPGQRRAAAARVNGQRTQPTGARSNLAPQARRPAPNSLADVERQLDEAISRGDNVF